MRQEPINSSKINIKNLERENNEDLYSQQISACMETGAALARQPLHHPDAEGHIIVVVAHLTRSGQTQWSSHRPKGATSQKGGRCSRTASVLRSERAAVSYLEEEQR